MNERSLNRLFKAHPLLRKLMVEASLDCPVHFEIGETARTPARQRELVRAGASTILNSRHIAKEPHHPWYGTEKVSHAVDIVCYIEGRVRWDWPLYYKAAEHIKQVAKKLNITITWGGDWKSLKDGPHFELSWRKYP